MRSVARVAVYYAPLPDDPLSKASAAWLGRDPSTGTPHKQPDLPDIAAVTSDPRSYGFHATLKPPLRLARDRTWEDFLRDARAMARRIAPFDLPPLAVSDVHGFLALKETEPSAALQGLADTCVAELDCYRDPPDDAELARRRRSQLSREQDAMLVRWGYPYVFGTWFFHMTLTRRLTPEEKAIYLPAAVEHFKVSIQTSRVVKDICIFLQDSPGAPFMIAARLPLGG